MPIVGQPSFLLFPFFARAYPRQSLTIVAALLAAGFAETIGISALLPLISVVIDQSPSENGGVLNDFIASLYALAGLEPKLEILLLTVVLTIVAKATIFFHALRYAGFVAADIARDFQMRLIRALMSAEWQYFTGLSVGAVSNAIATESQRAGHSYMLAGKTLAAFVQAAIYIGAAFIVSWKLSLLAILLGGVLAFLVKGVMRMAREAGRDLSETMDSLLGRLNDALSGAKPLKAMAQEERFCQKLNEETAAVVKARKQQYVSSLLIQIIYEPALVISLACGLWFVLTFTSVPVPQVLLLAFLFHRLMGYVSLAQSHYQNMLQNESAVWSLERQIDAAGKFSEKMHEGRKPSFNTSIDIDAVTIRYRNGHTVFEDFSASIPAKKVTVLFGPSGIGKTTLTDAVLGLLPVSGGEIRIDGEKMDDIDLRDWRRKTGYVPQDTFLFHDSIRKNITLGEGSYSEEDVTDALRQASAWEFVRGMPGGLDAVVGERGGRLSGGQRQRIALARALIRKPELLILDEPTSALDKDSETEIFETLKAVSASVAVILITHNPAAKKLADNLIDLQNTIKSSATLKMNA